MHDTVSLGPKNTLTARLQPVSFEINNLLLLLLLLDDDDIVGAVLCAVDDDDDLQQQQNVAKIRICIFTSASKSLTMSTVQFD